MESLFSSRKRDDILQNMTKQKYDVFIIGGGITGAGTALDAASRGMRAVLRNAGLRSRNV